MVKSHRSKRHHKKHRGGEGEATDNNSVLTMDESPAAETAMPASATPATASATPATATPAEEEKKGWFSSLFGGSKTKRVRFKRTRKTKRNTKRSSTKRSTKRKSKSKRSSSGSKRKGSSRK